MFAYVYICLYFLNVLIFLVLSCIVLHFIVISYILLHFCVNVFSYIFLFYYMFLYCLVFSLFYNNVSYFLVFPCIFLYFLTQSSQTRPFTHQARSTRAWSAHGARMECAWKVAHMCPAGLPAWLATVWFDLLCFVFRSFIYVIIIVFFVLLFLIGFRCLSLFHLVLFVELCF